MAALHRPKLWPFRALLAGAVVGPLALFVLGAWQTHLELYGQAEDNVRRQTVLLEEHAERTLQSVQLVIEQTNQRILGLSWDEIRSSRPLWEDLTQLVRQAPEVDAIFIVDPAGEGALTTRAFPSPRVDFSQRDYFVAQREAAAGMFLSGSYVGLISRHPIFNVSMRRHSASGMFDGVVGVSVADYFEKYYGSVVLPGDGAALSLVRADGQVLASYPASTGNPLAGNETAAATEEGLVYSEGHGTKGARLIGYKRLDTWPAYVTFSLSAASLREAWYRALWPWAILAVLGAIALCASTSVALRRVRREAEGAALLQETYANLIQEEKRRENAEKALFETRKLEALGQLTGGVAHDFNNLLQALGGSLDMADRRVHDERARRALAAGQRTVERGRQLVQKLLAFARRQPLQYQVFDVNERLRTVRDLLVQSAPGVTVTVAPGQDVWPVESDPHQLDLALLNLVVNARDAISGDEGAIRIETANVELNGQRDNLKGQFVAVTVRDNGSGMSPDVLQRVWEPFFTTKPAGKGTGLGLSMVHGFAHQSGGGVAIDTEPGRGTAVTLYLPKGAPLQTYDDPSTAAADDDVAAKRTGLAS